MWLSPARLIRALGRFAYKESRVECDAAEQIQIATRMLTSRGLPNNSLNRSGISLSFIENLPHDTIDFRQVNSGVRFLLNDGAQTSALTFTVLRGRVALVC
jgi:hypothetical protein